MFDSSVILDCYCFRAKITFECFCLFKMFLWMFPIIVIVWCLQSPAVKESISLGFLTVGGPETVPGSDLSGWREIVSVPLLPAPLPPPAWPELTGPLWVIWGHGVRMVWAGGARVRTLCCPQGRGLSLFWASQSQNSYGPATTVRVIYMYVFQCLKR